jgi:hypothetical protein
VSRKVGKGPPFHQNQLGPVRNMKIDIAVGRDLAGVASVFSVTVAWLLADFSTILDIWSLASRNLTSRRVLRAKNFRSNFHSCLLPPA